MIRIGNWISGLAALLHMASWLTVWAGPLAVIVATGLTTPALAAPAGGEAPARRIISLYPAHTENLFALGLDSEIVGVSVSDTWPLAALAKPRFHYRDDPERIIAARPDLVLIRPMIARSYPHLIEKLERVGIRVVSLQPRTVAEIHDYWRELGRLTGRAVAAEAMIAAFETELAAIAGKLATVPAARRKKVYFEAIHDRMKTFAPASIAAFVLERAGGINVAADAPAVRETNIAEYGKERILSRAAEIEVFLAQQGRMNPVSREAIINEPGFSVIRAVRQGAVYLVDEELVSRPTPRLAQGIRQIAAILYPEIFPPGGGDGR